MKYLVLGSSGQIGSELVNFLKKNGHTVITFDIIENPTQDLRIKGVLDEIIKDVDFVMFLAFDVGGSRYLKKYQNNFNFINNNSLLIINTFDSIQKYNKPFIFTSSQMSNMSNSAYGVCNSLGEFYTKSLGGLIVKFWNVYGYETDFNKSHVITDFILNAKNGQINMLTDGEEERQFLYVEDCVNALLILSQKYKEINRKKELHITSFKWVKIIDIAKEIQKNINCSINVSETKDDVQNNQKNTPNEFILKYWEPKIDLKTGIKKIINKMI